MVYPLSHYSMNWCYREGGKDFKIELSDCNAQIREAVFQVFSFGLHLLNREKGELRGELFIENSIPFRAGLGGSAVLSVAVSFLFHQKAWLSSHEIGPFAVSLENLFHGKSSGMDVYAVLEGRPLLYRKGSSLKSLPSPDKKKPADFASF